MPGRAERLLLLYKKLRKGKPVTITQLHTWCESAGFTCTRRQLQRDVSDLCELINDREETIEIRITTYNSKVYQYIKRR